jgi:hypothetical protein
MSDIVLNTLKGAAGRLRDRAEFLDRQVKSLQVEQADLEKQRLDALADVRELESTIEMLEGENG